MTTIAIAVQRLRAIVIQCGSQQKAAKKLGVSAAYLGELLRGTRTPGPKVLTALGMKREVVYTEDNNVPRSDI